MKQFLDITSVREILSKIVNLEVRDTTSLNFERTKKSTTAIALVLCAAVAYGFLIIPTAPSIIDSVLFLYPRWSGRDILLFIYFLPLSLILLSGVFWVIIENFWSQFGRFQRLLTIALPFVYFLAYAIFRGNILWLVGSLVSLVAGFILGYVCQAFSRRRQKANFREEMNEIKRLKENLRKLREEFSSEFQKEEKGLKLRLKNQLDFFKFAFELINKNVTKKLREIEAEYSLDLIPEKRYRRRKEYFDSIALNVKRLISEISA